jgi:hypothetical protein
MSLLHELEQQSYMIVHSALLHPAERLEAQSPTASGERAFGRFLHGRQLFNHEAQQCRLPTTDPTTDPPPTREAVTTIQLLTHTITQSMHQDLLLFKDR